MAGWTLDSGPASQSVPTEGAVAVGDVVDDRLVAEIAGDRPAISGSKVDLHQRLLTAVDHQQVIAVVLIHRRLAGRFGLGGWHENLEVWGPSGRTAEYGLETMIEGMKMMTNWHRDAFGNAMTYTSVTIILGFSILALSNFIPSIYFGLLTGLAMLIALIAALTLLPQLIIIVQPFGKSAA